VGTLLPSLLLCPVGLGHVFAIICYLSWIVRITHSSKPDRSVLQLFEQLDQA
jgi:hypothetical protein